MKEKYQYLGKNVILFALSSFLPKCLVFLMIPIYTSVLTTEEYGIADLINTTVSLLLPVFTMDIQDAVMRYSMDNDCKKEDVLSAGVFTIVKGGILLSILGCILSFWVFIKPYREYIPFVVIMYFLNALWNSLSMFCRGIDRVKTVTIASVLKSAVMLISNMVFLLVVNLGLRGYLLACVLGDIFALLFIVIHSELYQYIKLTYEKKVLKNMIHFSFPLIFSVIAWWINSASDRYILTWLKGVAVSGVFAVAYKIPSLLTTFQSIFSSAWSISAIKEFDREDSDGFISNMFTLMNFMMVIFCSGIMLMDVPLAKVLYSKDFFEAWRYVPPLLISVVFNAMALFVGSIFTAVKDTKTLSYSTIIGAVVNIICNFVLIYICGAYGAALATLIGYAVTMLVRLYILRKHIRLRVLWRRDIIGYVMLLLQMLVANAGWKSIFLQCLFGLIILGLYRNEVKTIRKTIICTLTGRITG